jgi:tRNA(fMet)-specific endonuclease VapC
VTRLLLDTTFLIDAERDHVAIDDLIDDDDELAIAAVSVAELRVGAILASGRRQTRRTAYVDDLVASVPIIDYDRQVAESHAELLAEVRRQGRPRGAHGLIIAATARAARRTVVTRNAGGFEGLPGVETRS